MQSSFEHSPVTITLIHTSASILTPMSNTIIDIYMTVLTRPTTCADTSIATGIIQHTASSIGAWLLIDNIAVTVDRYITEQEAHCFMFKNEIGSSCQIIS